MPARYHHPCQKPPSPKFLWLQSLKQKNHNILIFPLAEPLSQSSLVVFRTSCQENMSSPWPSLPLGLFAKRYSNGYNVWIPLHFCYICLIILQESICPFFGNVITVEPGESQAENGRFMSCPPVPVCPLLRPQPQKISHWDMFWCQLWNSAF